MKLTVCCAESAMLAMMSFVTRQYAEFTVFNGSKCFGPFSRKHTSCHSTLCASISRQRNKLAQRNKVQKEAHHVLSRHMPN